SRRRRPMRKVLTGILELSGQSAHYRRIELAAGAAAQLGQRLLSRSRPPVGLGRAHRVVGVAYRDDASAQRDLVVLEPIRVTAPIPALMARSHESRRRSQRRRGPEDPLTDDWVLARESPLVVGERAGLVEDRVGHGDLADVVEFGGALNLS